MSRFSITFKILFSKQPFASVDKDSNLSKLMESAKSQLTVALNYLNKVVDASHPATATYDELDRWASLVGISRLQDENDEQLRERIFQEFRNKKCGLTTSALFDSVKQLIGQDPQILERTQCSFPVLWGQQVLGKYDDIMRIIIVIPPELQNGTLDEIQNECERLILASIEALIVEQEEDHYKLLRRVNSNGN